MVEADGEVLPRALVAVVATVVVGGPPCSPPVVDAAALSVWLTKVVFLDIGMPVPALLAVPTVVVSRMTDWLERMEEIVPFSDERAALTEAEDEAGEREVADPDAVVLTKVAPPVRGNSPE